MLQEPQQQKVSDQTNEQALNPSIINPTIMQQQTRDFKHNLEGFKLLDIFNYDFDDPKNEKKWKNGDITDYFNYGFNEATFRCYQNKVKKQVFSLKCADYFKKLKQWQPQQIKSRMQLNVLNDRVPLDVGGLS